MSIIVWDGNTLACDSNFNDGQIKLPIAKVMVFAGAIYGFVGPVSGRAFLLSLNPRSLAQENTGIVVAERRVTVFERGQELVFPSASKLAIGSGRDFAYGALFMEASAKEAVLAAIQYSATCSGEVMEYRLDKSS